MTLHIITRFYCPKCGASWEQRSSLKHTCPNCQRKQSEDQKAKR